MQRRVAIQVLREIVNLCRDNSALISSVSLVPPAEDTGLVGYQLQIGTTCDESCRSSLMLLLKKRNLEMEEKEGFITIFKRR